MKTISEEEKMIVSKRLEAFKLDLGEYFVGQLLETKPRMEQHRLFWLVLEDKKYNVLRRALEAIKSFESGRYYKKAINMLKNANDRVQYSSNIAELIIAGFYMDAYPEKGSVIWERKVPGTKKSVDITLNMYEVPINIEVTGINENESIRNFYSDRYTVQDLLEPLILNKEMPQYSYIVNFGEVDLGEQRELPSIENLADFIIMSRQSGAGTYKYTFKDTYQVEVIISRLNKSANEYLADLTIWSGWLRDGLRIKSKVLQKAKDQLIDLPDDEFNFIALPNFAMLDNEDYIEAMWGQSIITIDPQDLNNSKSGYADNGISFETESTEYANIHGIIKTSFDYYEASEKFIVGNTRKRPPDKVMELLSPVIE